MTTLDSLLASYRTTTITERDKGTAFEKLVAQWLVTDPVQAQRCKDVKLWSDWAGQQDMDRSDVGIDLVGILHTGGLVAVQCKFYSPRRSIQKKDIDSFIAASGKHIFAERLIVETTEVPWSLKAEEMLRGQTKQIRRIGLRDLRRSKVDWSQFAGTGNIVPAKRKTLYPHQQAALEAVNKGLSEADRGKLIMACGTGKTLTSLRIAEDLVGTGGYVLYLVPSLALMAQSVEDWCTDAEVLLATFAVCSDTQVGKRRLRNDDAAELEITDLVFPATTNPESLAKAVHTSDRDRMRVVFATYQSIGVIATAQAEHGLPSFGLILCDEAHRTTGATFHGENKEQSNFVKVHDNSIIRGCKRLYMTATPRIYGENARSKARKLKATLASMDDTELYGKVLFYYGFARAVEDRMLTDYKVIVLVMDEGVVSASLQKRLSDGNSELNLDDATRIVGCWKALSRTGLIEQNGENEKLPEDANESEDNGQSMRRALAFCRDIRSSKMLSMSPGGEHRRGAAGYMDEFNKVVDEYVQKTADTSRALRCAVKHVDGTYNARERAQCLDWLKDGEDNMCRIVSNVRCLSEGVDVPALDAIIFLHPRRSQIDVVQSVGRVMRRAEGKKMGYVILPVGIPPKVSADKALDDNRRYQVVWQVLNALRSHDERLDAVINQGGLGEDITSKIAIVTEVDTLRLPTSPSGIAIGGLDDISTDNNGGDKGDRNGQLSLVMDEFPRAIIAKIVEKCGRRDYWEDWAKDVALIAGRHVTRITTLVEQPQSEAQKVFNAFLQELRDDLNDAITHNDAIDMLAQHLITRPVFDALFEGHAFVRHNPVSVALDRVLAVIDRAKVGRESGDLEGFYASVRRRATGITNPLLEVDHRHISL